jgi:hypothetical protein
VDENRSGRRFPSAGIPGWRRAAGRRASAARALAVGAALLAGAAALAPPARAAELSGRDVIARMQLARALGGDDARKVVRLTTVTSSGAVIERVFTIYQRWCDDASRHLIRFRAPADVADAALLTWARPDGSADMWLYAPELGRVRQLNAAARGESFMGTDLTFEDLSGYHLDVRTHRLFGEEELDGHATYKVESVPLETQVYARVLSWIDRATFLPVRVKFWDPAGRHLKTARFDDVRVVQDVPTIFRVEMTNVQSGHRTELALLDASYGDGVACERLTRRYLTNGR